MNRKYQEKLFPILAIIATAAVFFILGYATCFLVGPTQTVTTQVEYVPSSTTSILTTTTTTSVSTTTTASHKSTTDLKTTESEQTSTATTTQSIGEPPYNLNTVTKEQLLSIPGIGETYATRILEYRDWIGTFTELEQLKEIEGVGEKRYQQWIPYFTIS